MQDSGKRKGPENRDYDDIITKRLKLEDQSHSVNKVHIVTKRLTYDDYEVGWICALPLEMTAARAMLDEEHESLPSRAGDDNVYTLGSMSNHNVVIACLPDGVYGTTSATAVGLAMRTTYPRSVSMPLMVGIGGGVPSPTRDIRLGDVVVGVPTSEAPAIMQYDRGKTISDGTCLPKGQLSKPAPVLLSAVAKLKTEQELMPHRHANFISEALGRYQLEAYTYPGISLDNLHEVENNTSSEREHISRMQRLHTNPVIHYGTIGSGNQVMKHGPTRDRIAQSSGIICFETEAAGLMDYLPCLVVRGICDYCDAYKSKEFQGYAALAAAAYSKQLLSMIPPAQKKKHSGDSQLEKEQIEEEDKMRLEYLDGEYRLMPAQAKQNRHRDTLMKSLDVRVAASRRRTVKKAHIQTCRWFIEQDCFGDWLDPKKLIEHHGFLWIKGKPGTGKSTLMRFVLDRLEKLENTVIISFFFNARGHNLEKTTLGMYRSLTHQLIEQIESLRPLLDNIDSTIKFDDGNRDVLEDLFRRAIEELRSKTVLCFIDALDECPEDQIRDMVAFFEELGEAAVSNEARFHILFSSRHYPNISIAKGHAMSLEDEDGHSKDIVNYINAELKIGKTKHAREIKQQILDKCRGVFLWVILTLKILNTEYDKGRLHSLKQRLGDIPMELNNLFREIFLRDQQRIPELVRCLKLVLYARRPLTRKEFYFAMLNADSSVDMTEWDEDELPHSVMDNYILDCSRGLVEVTRDNEPVVEFLHEPTVQFIHESVREFLLKPNALKGSPQDIPGLSELAGHVLLRDCCSNYIITSQLSGLQIPERLPSIICWDNWYYRKGFKTRYPFLHYAMSEVMNHAERAEALGLSQATFLEHFRIDLWLRFNKARGVEWLRQLEFVDLTNILVSLKLNSMFVSQLHLTMPSKKELEALVTTAVAFQNFEACEQIILWLRGQKSGTNEEDFGYIKIFFELLVDAKSTHKASVFNNVVETFLDWPLNKDVAANSLMTLEFAVKAKRSLAMRLLLSNDYILANVDFQKLQSKIISWPPMSRQVICKAAGGEPCDFKVEGVLEPTSSFVLAYDTIACIEILSMYGQSLAFIPDTSVILDGIAKWADGNVVRYLVKKGAHAIPVIDEGKRTHEIAIHLNDAVFDEVLAS